MSADASPSNPEVADIAQAPPDRRKATVSVALTTLLNVAFSLVSNFALIPLYVTHLGARLYGSWAGVNETVTWLQAFDLGITNILIQRVASADSAGHKSLVAEWVGTSLTIIGIIATVIATTVLLTADLLVSGIASLAHADRAQLAMALRLGALASSMQIVSYVFVGYSRAVQRPHIINKSIVLSGPVALSITIPSLLYGGGLMALAATLLIRSSIMLCSGIASLWFDIRKGLANPPRFSKPILYELRTVVPSTLLGGVAYAALNQSELFLCSLLAGPLAAFTYMANRKAFELTKLCSDIVAFSSYGSFAHLAESSSPKTVLATYRRLHGIRSFIAICILVPLLSTHTSFVLLFLHGKALPSAMLGIAIGVQQYVTSGSFLSNYLYRATGAIKEGSYAMCVEAILKVTGIAIGIRYLGLIAIPLVGITISALFWFLVDRMLKAQLNMEAPETTVNAWLLGTQVALLLIASAIGATTTFRSWWELAGVASLTFIMAALVLAFTDSVSRIEIVRILRKSANA